MATTATSVIDRVLKGFRHRSQADVLVEAGGIAAGTTSFDVQGLLNNWGVSSVIEIDRELMLVTAVALPTVTVVRGWLGTQAVTHSQNVPIYINPRVLGSDILDLINDSLDDMFGNDLYAVDSKLVTYNSGLIGYNLDAAVVDVLRVDAETDSSAKLWEPVHDWHFDDTAQSTEFASGKALMLRASLPFGARFKVIYSKFFTQLSAESEDLEAIAGLRPYMTDIPYYFAMNRLMVDLERHRSQIETAQAHQRAQDTPPFLAIRTGEWYQARYQDRMRIARANLLKETKRGRAGAYGS